MLAIAKTVKAQLALREEFSRQFVPQCMDVLGAVCHKPNGKRIREARKLNDRSSLGFFHLGSIRQRSRRQDQIHDRHLSRRPCPSAREC